MQMSNLSEIVIQVRRDIVRMVHRVNSGHPGGSLGCAEFMVTLYFKIMKRKKDFKFFPVVRSVVRGSRMVQCSILPTARTRTTCTRRETGKL